MLLRRGRAMITVFIMLDVALYSKWLDPVSAADISKRTGLAQRGIEPTLQVLARASFLERMRGRWGGYRLGRPRRQIFVSDILAAMVSDASESDDRLTIDLFTQVIEPTWQQLDDKMLHQLQGLSLEDLTRKAESAGLHHPSRKPITFSI